MRYLILLLATLCCGCATTRTSIVVTGEFDGVDVSAVCELGPQRTAK